MKTFCQCKHSSIQNLFPADYGVLPCWWDEEAEINPLKTPEIGYWENPLFNRERISSPLTNNGRMFSGNQAWLSALALCGTWQTVVKISHYWHLSTLWFRGRKTETEAITLNLSLSLFLETHADIRRDSKRFTDVQSTMTVMLSTWLTDQLTIKISKAIPVACWQLVQLFAPVSPALHMCLEWIILACARQISPFLIVTSSSSITAEDQRALYKGPRGKGAGVLLEMGYQGWQGYHLRLVLDN